MVSSFEGSGLSEGLAADLYSRPTGGEFYQGFAASLTGSLYPWRTLSSLGEAVVPQVCEHSKVGVSHGVWE